MQFILANYSELPRLNQWVYDRLQRLLLQTYAPTRHQVTTLLWQILSNDSTDQDSQTPGGREWHTSHWKSHSQSSQVICDCLLFDTDFIKSHLTNPASSPPPPPTSYDLREHHMTWENITWPMTSPDDDTLTLILYQHVPEHVVSEGVNMWRVLVSSLTESKGRD